MAKLTAKTAKALKPGQVLRDDVVHGLQLHGREAGGSWLYCYTTPEGIERRPKLAKFPALGIEAAREVARHWAKQIAMGADLSADRAALRVAPTMDELFADYLAHKKTRKAERSLEEDRRNWKNHISPRVGDRKATAIEFGDVEAILKAVAVVRYKPRENARDPNAAPVKTGGRIAANRVRALLSGVLTYAERSTVNARPKGSNPIAETDKQPERKRRRHIKRDEFVAVYRELELAAATKPRHVAALRCSLYCATRVSELLTARWDWLDGAIVRLPKHKTFRTTGEARIVRVPEQALAILKTVPRDASGLLFGAGIDRWAIGKVWRRVVRKAGCPDIQPRDLRRTFASVAKTIGAELEHVGEILGHGFGDPTVTAGYAYLYDEEATALTQRTADEIDKLGAGQ
jgi:integrase